MQHPYDGSEGSPLHVACSIVKFPVREFVKHRDERGPVELVRLTNVLCGYLIVLSSVWSFPKGETLPGICSLFSMGLEVWGGVN